MRCVRSRPTPCSWPSAIFITRLSSAGNSLWTLRVTSSPHPGRPVRALRACLPLATSPITCIARPSPPPLVAVWRPWTPSAGWRHRGRGLGRLPRPLANIPLVYQQLSREHGALGSPHLGVVGQHYVLQALVERRVGPQTAHYSGHAVIGIAVQTWLWPIWVVVHDDELVWG